MIFINFKTYPETSDQKAIELCKLIQNTQSTIPVIPCLQATDIKQVTQAVDLPVWTQHLDPVELGKHTGFTAPEAVKKDGAIGTLLNHSEHPIDLDVIKKTLTLCHKHQLKVMIITDTLKLLKKVTKLNPDYLGFEDPKLIGGPTPMIKAHPDVIRKAVQLANQPLIVGGGIRSTQDVKTALELGAKGILLASEFAKSQDHQVTLNQLIAGFN